VAVLTDANWNELAPQGKEVDAIVGDIVLRNRYVTAVIAQPTATRHANMSVRDVGGGLLDLTTRDQPSDQLHCFYPGRREYQFRSWRVHSDHAPLDSIEVTPDLHVRGPRCAVIVTAAGTADLPEVMVEYVLGLQDRALTIVTAYNNTTDKAQKVVLADDLRLDGGKEDQFRMANGIGRTFGWADRFWQQAYLLDSPEAELQFNTDTRTARLTYLQGNAGTYTLEPHTSHSIARHLACGSSLAHAVAAVALDHGGAVTPVTLAVRDANGKPLLGSRVEITRDGEYTATLATTGRGETTVPLAAGHYAAAVLFNGVKLGEASLTVQPAEQQQQSILLDDFLPGGVEAHITDGDGRPVACKVEFNPQEMTPLPSFGPDTAEYGVGNLRYAPDGTFTQTLHPGTYDVIVSHGPEYDAVFSTVTVKAGEVTQLKAKLPHVVDTTGWISSDLHSHSTPSGDNTSSQHGRVLNLLCEHIEFAPCTEHNRITTYQEHIDRLKIAKRFASCAGMELTGKPLPLDHQNAFPLHHHPHRQDGGGPVTADSPEDQIERLALWDDRSEKLVQQNHPDMGWLFRDKNGDGQPDEGFTRAFGFMDAIEVHPIDAAWKLRQTSTVPKEWSNRIFHWLQLINQGHRIPGVVNTDSHYNLHGSGGLRNWLESPTDRPGDVKVMDMVHAVEHGHIIMSNGPFLKVFAKPGQGEGDTAGGELTAPDGRITLDIQVQSPNWIDVDEVFVLINGEIDPEHHYTRANHADRFQAGVVKFEGSFPLKLKGDSHLIVVAGAPDKTLGPVAGGSWAKQHPTAVSDPIYVDVDGGGFTSNKDTLGQPLPVKNGTPQ
ncbi:MAG: CehA/McbA family metallohydrolase, partial [Planctomycetaceae bacterium]